MRRRGRRQEGEKEEEEGRGEEEKGGGEEKTHCSC